MTSLSQGTYKRLRPAIPACPCAAYPFPHRFGGGKCEATQDSFFCDSCRLPCSPRSVDFGIGAFEHFGYRGRHTDKRIVSNCCASSFTHFSDL